MDQTNPIKAALNECRPLFISCFWFGLFINLLMLAVPIYSLQVLDRVLSSNSVETLLMLTLIVGIALIFMGLLQVLRSSIFTQIGRWLDDKLSMPLVKKTVELAAANKNIGSQPIKDLSTIKSFISSPALASIFDAPWAILYFIVIFIINTTLGYLVVAGAVILIILAIFSEKTKKAKMGDANEANVKSGQAIESMLRNAEVIRAMGFLPNASKKWQEHNKNSKILGFAIGNFATLLTHFTKSFRMGLQMIVTGLGAYLVLNQQMSAGGIIAVSILSGKALGPFDAAPSIMQSWVGVKKAMERLAKLNITLTEEQKILLVDPEGNVQIEKLSFQESSNKKWILRGININIQAGEAIGVIGPSGTGKTTLARLLVSVLQPTSGSVRLAGAALSDWNEDQLGSLIGYLPQDVELFEGSISDNISKFSDDVKDEDIIAAANIANIHDFVLKLPHGYQTQIGVGGNMLSAGQRQRVALARCFFGKPKLVVLDEPTSNLDSEGEQALIKCLENAKAENITTITIVHRPQILQKVDKILVLHDGEAKMFDTPEVVFAKMASKNLKIQNIDSEDSNIQKIKADS
ncbi:MAG: type I secretion system permease/ATPase [Rhizobiales bacterium]|nr:type I secretion system permease/ATPase [Hyphomicrobiales bacterium]